MRFFKRKIKKRKVATFWIIWIIIWVVVNLFFSRTGLTIVHRVWYYLLEGIVSCLVAYIMTQSKIFRIMVYAFLIFKLVGNVNLIGITCFALNLWLAVRTARICRA